MNNLYMFIINVNYEYDDGFEWDTDKVTVVAYSTSDAIKFAKKAVMTNQSSKLINIISCEVIYSVDLKEKADTDGVINYPNKLSI